MRPKSSSGRREWEAAPARDLEGRIGDASGRFSAVQSLNQEVGKVRNSLGTDLREPEYHFLIRVDPDSNSGKLLAGPMGLKEVGIQDLLGIRGCGQMQG